MNYHRYKCPRGHTYNAGGWHRWPKDTCRTCGYTEKNGEGPIIDSIAELIDAIDKAALNEI